MRILVADDHEVIRRGVRALLAAGEDCEICGEAVDGQDAVEKAHQLHPDLIIMDVSMPNLNGLEATRMIRRSLPTTQVLILTQHDSQEMMRQARTMLGDALDAFVRGDANAARAICRRDDGVDALRNSVFRILLTHMMEDPHIIGAGMDLFLVSRNLERVADLATNIAEDVVFLVEGKMIKHHIDEDPAQTQPRP